MPEKDFVLLEALRGLTLVDLDKFYVLLSSLIEGGLDLALTFSALELMMRCRVAKLSFLSLSA